MKDLRNYPRVVINRPIRIKTSSGAVVQARMANISQGGIAVFYEAPAEIGATLELSFSLMVRGRQIDFKLKAIARYNYLSGNGYVIGFEFTDMDTESRNQVKEFVAHKRSMKD